MVLEGMFILQVGERCADWYKEHSIANEKGRVPQVRNSAFLAVRRGERD
jgi:hypothetical protein